MSNAYRDAVNALGDDVRRTLRRTDGFLDLQMVERARRELEHLPPAYLDNLVCERVFMRLAFLEEDWPRVSNLAERHARVDPDDWGMWVQWAYAKRRASGLAEAREILMQAWDRFPEVAVIPYNLACYACREANLHTARDLLGKAFALNDAYRALALEDEDLEALWGELEG